MAKRLETDREAIELIGVAMQFGARLVAIPVERFGDDFFRLRTRLAGEIVQKFVKYRRRLAIVGDISKHAAESPAFAAFVNEANRGKDIWFVRDLSELEGRLKKRAMVAGDPDQGAGLPPLSRYPM